MTGIEYLVKWRGVCGTVNEETKRGKDGNIALRCDK